MRLNEIPHIWSPWLARDSSLVRDLNRVWRVFRVVNQTDRKFPLIAFRKHLFKFRCCYLVAISLAIFPGVYTLIVRFVLWDPKVAMADYDRRPRGGRPQFQNRKRRRGTILSRDTSYQNR
jgi:hypothetical protein